MPIMRLLGFVATFISLASSHKPSIVPADVRSPNSVAGTWSLVTANTTTNNTTTPAFGSHPIGILIFAPTLYFSELITISPSEVPHFPSNSDRTSGTAAQNAAVIAGTLAQIGTYTVDDQGRFRSERILASTFPNWDGLVRDTRSINETAVGDGGYLRETLHDAGSASTVHILWRRIGSE